LLWQVNVWDGVQRTLARCCNVQFAAHACHVSERPIQPKGGGKGEVRPICLG